MRISIVVLTLSSFISFAQASFVYAPTAVVAESDKTAVFSIEALIEKNCPTAKKLKLIGTSIETSAQHGGFGSVYTVTYGVQLQNTFIPNALMVRSQWEDDFGGKTIPFKVLVDTFLLCE